MSEQHIPPPHLQGQAVVSRRLVFAAVVLAVIHVHMVQLQEAHQISGRLQRGRHGGRVDTWLMYFGYMCVKYIA